MSEEEKKKHIEVIDPVTGNAYLLNRPINLEEMKQEHDAHLALFHKITPHIYGEEEYDLGAFQSFEP